MRYSKKNLYRSTRLKLNAYNNLTNRQFPKLFRKIFKPLVDFILDKIKNGEPLPKKLDFILENDKTGEVMEVIPINLDEIINNYPNLVSDMIECGKVSGNQIELN